MTSPLKILIFTSFCAVSCSSLTPEQVTFLDKANNIKKYPVERNILITTMGLESLKSQRSGGSVRSHRMRFSEQWKHPSGLMLTGYDSQQVGDFVVTRESIDKFLRGSSKISGIPGFATNTLPRKSFQSIQITSNRGKNIYNSSDKINPIKMPNKSQ